MKAIRLIKKKLELFNYVLSNHSPSSNQNRGLRSTRLLLACFRACMKYKLSYKNKSEAYKNMRKNQEHRYNRSELSH